MQEELDDEFVHFRAFGERQGFAHQTPEALAQGVVETLDGVGWTSGIRGLVLGCWEHVVIAFRCSSQLGPVDCRRVNSMLGCQKDDNPTLCSYLDLNDLQELAVPF